ncbi:hypothetical protein K7X08_023238 [Anisodus acutangulus]|uniref:Helicase protein MOM1-like n=1 Tax=Anisodus acutangulus TaxID=402998 RepID=A0A9Q1R157_9SOLA|nr:hypothetical protein K7X08_023238 [Anisodus acutangulus]
MTIYPFLEQFDLKLLFVSAERMASETRSGKKNKDTESNKSKNKQSDKGSLSSGSGKTDRASLRSSDRETKQPASSPSSTRKSKRLEKQSPSPPAVNRKAGVTEKQNSPSPLRRSDRGKKHTPSSSSRSSLGRGSDSSSVKKKEKKEKSVKELIMESESHRTSTEKGEASVGLKRKRMDARSYRALFKMQRKRFTAPEINDKSERPKKQSKVDSIPSDEIDCKLIDGDNESHERVVDELREDHGVASARSISSLEASVADASVNDVEELANTKNSAALPAENGSEVSKNGCTVGEISGDSERVTESCSVPEDNMHIAELACSTSTNGDIILESGELGIGNCPETHNNTCDLAEVSPPPLGDLEKLGYGGPCASCSRWLRLNHDSPEEELCSCAGMSGRDYSNLSSLKDRVASEAAILLDSGEGCNMQLNEALSVSQRGSDEKMCAICKQGGKILICDGRSCKRCYHLSCLDPPLDDFPPGAWHCTWCVKKKIESGVHSVTEGVESILDVREVEVAGAKGMHRQKQYLVKYQGLAHAHNHWVAEAQLLIDAPLLIANYNHKNQDVRWISDWTVPHRLLKKRSLMFSKLHGQDAGDNNKCLFEWLVKWKGLGYEYATWELGNANFLNSQHGENLIKNFNIRREKAKWRIGKNHRGPLVKLSELSAGGSLITDSNLLNNVNKLRECWLKCQNTAVFEDQDRIMKMVLFILSLSDVCCPVLIVTTSSSLPQWEAEFTRWAPSIDVVVYSGSRDSRRRIKSLEFYDEGGFMMLQVLLSSLEAVIEDVEILSGLSLEVTIIDDCQNLGISARVEQIKMLSTGVRVLLFNGPMKITSSEYINLLSLLQCKFGLDKTGGVESDFGKLKRLTKISDVQLEQYCATLLTNSNALQTFSKSDPVGALRDILLSVRKCCDHPYILDPLLQPFNKGLSPAEILEVGIKASGKLQFLDKMLAEMRLRQHRVVVLFQSIVGSGVSIGDILDDFLRQRFGEDSYERVETGVVHSRKQASLNRFNNKESGRFVLLLENRVCHPSIKLSSVDNVIIYDGENPANDLRQLQRISIDSQSKYISVFRLYSCFTVEERALVLAKQDLNLDSNLHSISRGPNNTLMWGASNLFSRLDEYHSGGIPTSISNNSSGPLLLNDVISEFSAIISTSSEDKDICHSVISKVQMSMGTYSANIPLLGEKKMELKIGEEPHVFWKTLLDGRNPQWRNLSRATTPRNRKRVQYFDECPDPPNGNDEIGKKRRKVVNHSADAIPTHPSPGRGEVAASKGGAHENDDIGGEHVSRSLSHLLHEAKPVRPEEGRVLYNEQKSLHIHLKAELAKLFEVLKLSDAVKHTVGKFLEYVMENHRVSREPATILQAFQLSLCWVAASILKKKIDKVETFLLAKQHLQFGCTEEETNNVCLKIRSLKKLFLQRLDQNDNASSSSKCSLLAARSVAEEPSTGSMSQAVESPQLNVQKEMEERLQVKKLSEECIVMPKEELVDIERENFIKEVQYRCERRMSKLVQKQKEEIEEFQKIWEKKKEELEEDYRLQFDVLRSIYGQNAATKDKQKTKETEFSRKMQELKCDKDQHLKELEVEHSAMKNKEMQKAASWLAQANSFRGAYPIDGVSCSQENVNVSHNSPQIVRPVAGHHVEELNAGNILDSTGSDVPASTSDESDILPIASTNVSTTPATEDLAGVKSVDGGLVAKSKRLNEVGGSSEEIVSEFPLPPEEHTEVLFEDPAREHLLEVSGTGLNIVVGNDHSEVNNVIEELNTEHDSLERNSHLQSDEDNPMDAVRSADRNQISPEELVVDVPSVAAILCSDDGDSLPQNQCSGYNGRLTHEMPLPENQSGTQVEVDAGQCGANNSEAVLINSSEQQQPASDGFPLAAHEPPSDITHHTHNDKRNFNPNLGSSSHLDGGTMEPLQAGGNSEECPSVDVDMSPLSCDRPNFSEVSRVDPRPISEWGASSHNINTPVQAVLQHNTNVAVVQGPRNVPVHPDHQVATWSSTLPPNADPLHEDWERIHKEREHATKILEDMKLRLKSDCEKEIEEMIAQIRKKYDEKLQEVEAGFLRKKKELDVNQNKVLMNKLLADAFRCKCMNLKPSGLPGMRRVVPSSYMQHLHQVSQQPNLRSSHVTGSSSVSQQSLRATPVTGLSSAGQAQVRQETSVPSNRSVHSGGNSQSTVRCAPVTGLSLAGQPAPTQQTAAVSRSTAHSAGRPPLISAITPSTGNLRVGGEIRAPAPHLQPFRPPTSMSTSSSSSTLFSTNMSASLDSLPPLASLQTSSPSQLPQHQIPSPLVPQVAVDLSSSRNATPQHDIGGLPAAQNPSISAQELLYNVENRPHANRPNIMPSLPDVDSDFDLLDLSEFQTLDGVHGGSTSSALATNVSDVVCVSDDD